MDRATASGEERFRLKPRQGVSVSAGTRDITGGSDGTSICVCADLLGTSLAAQTLSPQDAAAWRADLRLLAQSARAPPRAVLEDYASAMGFGCREH
jgi:hypothetical protein